MDELRHISGLNYIDEFINQEEEVNLIQLIDAMPWRNDLKRRVQHYGYIYDYKSRKILHEISLALCLIGVRPSVSASLIKVCLNPRQVK